MINSYVESIRSKLDTVSIKPGQQIFCPDSMELFIDDSESERKQLHDIIVLPTEADRTSLLAPIPNKMYLILDSKILWIYVNSIWFALNDMSSKQNKTDESLKTNNKDLVAAMNELFDMIQAK